MSERNRAPELLFEEVQLSLSIHSLFSIQKRPISIYKKCIFVLFVFYRCLFFCPQYLNSNRFFLNTIAS